MNKAICETLTHGKVLGDQTFSGKSHNIRIPKTINSDCQLRKIEFFVEKFRSVLENTCKGKSDIALALSAGKDSRTLLGLLLSIDIKPTCITYSYHSSDPEVVVAKKICESFGLTHKYIPISPDLYFIEDNIINLLKLTDGNPLYFPMMPSYFMKDQLSYNILFSGNLMTEYMDTAEYRIYEGRDIAKALLSKETITDFLTTEAFDTTYQDLVQFYSMNLNRLIVNRMVERIVQLKVMKNFINWDYPILDESLLRELFLLPLEIRTGSKLTRMIMKQYFPDLLRFPTGRSPFSARYPLIMHQAYAKATKRKTNKGFDHIIPKLLENIEDFKFDQAYIDNEKVRKFMLSPKSRTKTLGTMRLLNLYKWSKYKEVL